MIKHYRKNILPISIVFLTLMMIVLRFLLNEKGRVTPDSIRLMRTANALPIVDNTVTPLGYPLFVKTFTFFCLDEFWASKLLGILCFLLMIIFSWKKNFYFKEIVISCSLFSFVSIFAATFTETLFLPFALIFLFVASSVIDVKLKGAKAVLLLSLSLILLYNIRYSALFFVVGIFVYGIWNRKKEFSKTLILSSCIAFGYVVLYKFFFIDEFNGNYVSQFLELGLHPTSKLLLELFQGLATTFNPFVHIANPNGGFLNIGIYGIGSLTIVLMIFLFAKTSLSDTEQLFLFLGVFGILCSFFIQYFYSLDALDYRLLIPFALPVWLVFFKIIYNKIHDVIFGISIVSLSIGFVFIWLSKGDYLENRKSAKQYLAKENLLYKRIYFYNNAKDNTSEDIQVAELLSTINPRVYIVSNPKDTLDSKVLTAYKVKRNMKIINNKFQ